eukprot:352850-Chlamydomonas_euryale.AAC.3
MCKACCGAPRDVPSVRLRGRCLVCPYYRRWWHSLGVQPAIHLALVSTAVLPTLVGPLASAILQPCLSRRLSDADRTRGLIISFGTEVHHMMPWLASTRLAQAGLAHEHTGLACQVTEKAANRSSAPRRCSSSLSTPSALLCNRKKSVGFRTATTNR